MIPAIVTAGGRLDGALAEAVGHSIKALTPIGGVPLVRRVLGALEGSGVVRETVVVGPVEHLADHCASARVLPEGATGIENLVRGLEAVDAGEGFALVAASDLPFLCADSVRHLVAQAPSDADIVFPVITRAAYESHFPGSPNTWAKLRDGELTGGSVMLVRPAAIARNRALIERVFAARKSQWQMARLLGLGFAVRMLAGQLSVAAAEARATTLTGCRCRALPDSHPHLACDMDTHEEYLYLSQLAERHR